MDLSESEKQIEQNARKFARENKKAIAKRLTCIKEYPPEKDPVSVFMAGSPGAGKTESAKVLLGQEETGQKILYIDPDDLRNEFEAYSGDNSYLFQGAVSLLVEKIHDQALKQKQSFLLDGTLSSYRVAEKNIARSLNKKRFVMIYYVYQDPVKSWEFVKAREKSEGRRILKEDFINQYFAARGVVNGLKKQFGSRIHVDILLKSRGEKRVYKANVRDIDSHITEQYTRESLLKTLD